MCVCNGDVSFPLESFVICVISLGDVSGCYVSDSDLKIDV